MSMVTNYLKGQQSCQRAGINSNIRCMNSAITFPIITQTSALASLLLCPLGWLSIIIPLTSITLLVLHTCINPFDPTSAGGENSLAPFYGLGFSTLQSYLQTGNLTVGPNTINVHIDSEYSSSTCVCTCTYTYMYTVYVPGLRILWPSIKIVFYTKAINGTQHVGYKSYILHLSLMYTHVLQNEWNAVLHVCSLQYRISSLHCVSLSWEI